MVQENRLKGWPDGKYDFTDPADQRRWFADHPGYAPWMNKELAEVGQRIKVLSSRWVLIIAGGLMQAPAVKAAHKLGFKVVVSDRNLDCYCASLADHFVELDTFDVFGHVDFIKHWPHGFAAVFTAAADPIVTVAHAAQAAGCHGIPVNIAEVCADKSLTRDALYSRNVPQPLYKWFYSNLDGLHRALDYIRTDDLILKATGSSGSRGHTRGTRDDFQSDYFARTAIAIACHYSNDYILLEELLTGVELSVESLWYNGVMIPLNAVARPFLDHPQYSIELGHYNPAGLDADTYDAVWGIVGKAGRAVGLDETFGGHIFKADLILTDDGPKVLELTLRLSGGLDSGWTSPLAHGTNYTKGALLLALGEPLEASVPFFAKRQTDHAACIAVFGPEQGGIVKAIHGVEQAQEYAEVVQRFWEGDVLPPLTDCAARVAFCIASSPVQGWAIRKARKAAELIKVEVSE